MKRQALTGIGELIRLILRQDRIVLTLWIVLAAAVVCGTAASYFELAPTPELQQAYAEQINGNPAIVALQGPVFRATVGGLTAQKTGTMGVLLAGVVSVFFLTRHTRAEEEAGRRELLGSAVVGRHAPLTAALVVVLGANLAIAALIAAGLIWVGLPAAGSVSLGLSWAAVGWIFAAIAAVAAQLTENARFANFIALMVFGLFYLMRIAGDAAGDREALAWLSWVSPVGWTRLTLPFAGERWGMFVPIIGLVVVLTVAAYALSARRDLGAGFFRTGVGPAAAAPGLRSPLALAWRLQRGLLLGWTAGFGAIGAILGGIVRTVSDLLNQSQAFDWAKTMSGREPIDAFFATFLYALSLIISGYAIAAALRLRSEEVGKYAEPVLAAAVSRIRWAVSHLFFAVLGPVVILAALGLGAGLTYGLSTGRVGSEMTGLLAAALRYVPPIWVMAGLAMALFGLLPRLAVFVSWAAFAACLLLELLWELQQVGPSVFQLSPFAHVHPSVEWSAGTAVWQAGLAATLAWAGLFGIRRRSIG